MIKRLFLSLFVFFVLIGKTQCPQVYDYLGNLSSNPSFISCTGNAYALNFQSNSNWGAYTINWGDLSIPSSGLTYSANSIISHTYAATTSTYAITLTIPSQNCTLTGFVAVEQPVFAGVVVAGGVALACAPKTLTFTNVSTFTSATTTYTWNFGDGSPLLVLTFTNSGQNVTHTYQKGTVNCQTQVMLQAMNYCTFGAPTSGQVNPLYVYDIDIAAITPDRSVRCWPDNIFSFSNTTARNCVPQGNTFQRQERWNFGDYWGRGYDSIIGWNPWPPTAPISISYSALGTYSVVLLDSNQCGVDIVTTTVSIVNPPTASLIIPSGNLCQNTSLTFTNLSTPGNTYLWNFGTGGGFVNLGAGNKSHTYVTPGPYTVTLITLIGGAGNACSDTVSAVINILAAPVANFSLSPSTGCNSLSAVTFTNFSTGGATYAWNLGNGNTSTSITPLPQNYTLTGTFITSLVVTATTGCIHTFSTPVIVRPKPLPNFTQFAACVGTAINFTNSSTPTTGANAITSYTWNFGDGSPKTSSVSPVHTFTAPNNYSVKLIATSAFCIDSIVKTVTVNIQPTANFVTTPTIGCPPLVTSFSNTSLNGITYLWKFGTSSTATSAIISPTFQYANATQNFQTFTVTLIASTGIGCADSLKQTITVRPKPVANFISNITAGCSPFVASFTNTTLGGSTYSWTLGDGGTSALPNPTHTYTNNSLFQQTVNVQMVATNSVGCKDTITKPLIVYAKPDVSVTMVPSNGCHPLTVNFPAVPGVATYTWNHGDGSPLLITTLSPHTHTFTNTGLVNQSYTVSLIASNVSGCIDSAKGTVLVFPKPIASIAIIPTVGCSPFTSTLSGTSNLSGSNYSWNFGDGQSSNTGTTSSSLHTYSNTTNTVNQNYTTSLVVSTINGCKDSVVRSLLVFFKPNAGFVLDTPKCVSPIISFTNISTGGSLYSWIFGDSSPNSSLINPIHTYSNNTLNNQTYSVTLIVTSASACKDTAYGNPIVYTLPEAGILMTPSVGCSPLSVTLTSTSQFAHTYLWKFGDGFSSTSAGTIHTYTNLSNTTDQTFSCTLYAMNNNGCSDSLTLPVLVNHKPAASFTHTDPKCASNSVTFINTSAGSNSQSWNFGDNSTSTAPNPLHTFTNTTINNITFTVLLTVSTSSACTDTSYGNPIIYAKPIADFSLSPAAGCAPLSTNLFFTGANAHTFLWKFGDGGTSNSQNTTHTYTNSSNSADQNYNASIVAVNNNGCRDSITKPVLVYFRPFADFSLDTPACSPKKMTFTNKSINATSFNWNLGNGQTSTATGTVSQEYVNTSTSPISFLIRLIATTANNCSDTNLVSFFVYPRPNFIISSAPDSGCSPLRVHFNKIGGVTKFQWTFEPGNYSGSDEPDNIFANTGNEPKIFRVQLIADDIHQCVDTAIKIIKVYPQPTAKFTASPLSVYIPLESTKCFNLSSGAVAYIWNFGDGEISTEKDPVHNYRAPGEFEITLIAMNAFGCADTAKLPEKVVALSETSVEIPNAFSPNLSGSPGNAYDPEDRTNDIFHPNVKGADQYVLSIYSRWGELLFETKNVNEGWDGYYKGKLCTQDVYVWKIIATFLDGKRVVKTGDVLLLR